MNLVIQHPGLSDDAVRGIAAELGRAPAQRDMQTARWTGTGLDGRGAAALGARFGVDAAAVPPGRRMSDFRLIAFDMDSTLITIECVDEIADFAGRKAEVAAITEAAMRGEISDYCESLRRRVALLAGLGADALQRVFDERLRITPGAKPLIDRARAAGLKVLLVSGGFTYFTDRLRTQLDLDFVRANALELRDGRLTGGLVGDIVDARVKRETVEATCARIGCAPAQAIVVGDGANDLEMMGIAGVSVAYHAKPVVRERTTDALQHCGLDALLNLFDDTAGAPVSAPAR